VIVSLPSSTDPNPNAGGPYRKPKPDLYTVLLAIALVSVLMGILFLYLEMSGYGFKFKGGPAVGMAAGWLTGHADRLLGMVFLF
jgi:hypothetical protein